RLWEQAVTEAQAEQVDAVLKAVRRQSLKAPEGIISVDASTLHTWRPVYIGRIRGDGQFEVVWRSETPVRPIPFPSSRPRGISAGSLEKSVRQHLMAISDSKTTQLEAYIRERRSDLAVLGRTPSVMEAMQRLTEIRRSQPPDSPAYREATQRVRLVIESFAET